VARRITTAIALSVTILQGCAAPPPAPLPATDAQKKQAEHDFVKCAIQHEPEVDDRTSDASTIALVLTNRCIAEYNAVTEIWFAGSHDRKLIQQWKQGRATPQEKIEASLDVVVSMRGGAKPNPNF
jgi:hypothetical protein